jgi:hypothetical protein
MLLLSHFQKKITCQSKTKKKLYTVALRTSTTNCSCGVIYLAYQEGKGPWFDCVSVYFEACTIKKKKFLKANYPCKVVVILPKQHKSFLGETEVIVQCAE